MSIHDVMERLGAAVEARVLELWQRWQDGELSETEFRALARAELVQAGARSTALADVALSAALTRLSRREEAPVGQAPPRGEEDARRAVDETLASESYRRDPSAAVKTLGSAFAYDTFQTAYQEGMQERGVTYWRRSVEPSACVVCEDLRSGILESTTTMWHHKGCRCVQEPLQMETQS